jgi:hypothetical protein
MTELPWVERMQIVQQLTENNQFLQLQAQIDEINKKLEQINVSESSESDGL